jgi:three-Cys-motif partner protein
MPRNSHFELFQDHTRLKHFLLEVYLKQWATILISGRQRAGAPIPKMLWFVDAFAGAGRDGQGTPGSPVIAAEIAKEINSKHYPPGRKSGMRVLAIEEHAGRFKQLDEALKPYSAVVEVRHGTLTSILGNLMPFLVEQAAPTLFFLDPFGVHGLDAKLLPQILHVDRTEILLLFSDEGAVRLAGKAEAKVPTRDELLAQRQDGRLSLGDDLDAEINEQDRLNVEQIIAGHASNPRAAQILDVTFGGKDWRKIVENTPAPQRRQAFVDLYREVLEDAGAKYVLPFAVTTGEGRHKYTLMHASMHPSAFVAMKEAMHRAHKQRQKPVEGEDLFGASGINLPVDEFDQTFSSRTDIKLLADQLRAAFPGKLVPWAGKRRDESVSSHVLRHSSLLNHELPLLEKELISRGYRESKRPLTFRFPSMDQ